MIHGDALDHKDPTLHSPRDSLDLEDRVGRVTSSDSLKVRGEVALAVEGKALLGALGHLLHVHLLLALVLLEAEETLCRLALVDRGRTAERVAAFEPVIAEVPRSSELSHR